MPYVDLYSDEDYASIYYTTNAPYGNVSGFDPEKPTIIILHPMFLDSSWVECQMRDPRLDLHYNLIAFDMRSCGKSTCQYSGKHDSWVDAADLAFCHQKLNLPPCHVFALEALSVNCALRFALLFPEMCLSLALCNVPAPTDPRWTQGAITELMHSWCFAEDHESLEHAAAELLTFLIGPKRDADLQDEIVEYWMKYAPPYKRPWIIETTSVLINRSALSAAAYAEITQPVLILHGDRNELHPRKHSEALAAQLTGAKDGAVIYTVKGAATYLSIIPGSASIVNQTLAKFISRIPHTRTEIGLPGSEEAIPYRMNMALARQAELTRKKYKEGTLDPLCPLSFSALPQAAITAQTALITQYARDRFSAYNPLGPDGRPIRKMSEGREAHWFQGEKGGVSVVATTKFKPTTEGSKKEPEKPARPDKETSNQLVKPAVLTSAALDKYNVRGPMAKVVRESPAPLTRLLMQ